jgi:hypothetical protein
VTCTRPRHRTARRHRHEMVAARVADELNCIPAARFSEECIHGGDHGAAYAARGDRDVHGRLIERARG